MQEANIDSSVKEKFYKLIYQFITGLQNQWGNNEGILGEEWNKFGAYNPKAQDIIDNV